MRTSARLMTGALWSTVTPRHSWNVPVLVPGLVSCAAAPDCTDRAIVAPTAATLMTRESV
ncbi:hypothetical protein ACFRCX_35900 [Streptomyces sp. NPDC056652]|uniref:hypothetical protein n=1 Tax=Streptomyces sp. NPDC056652 TaxID=3345893 RepID=UPI0036996284